MYKQETILYEDTYEIHITKDYVDNILIEEIHYDNNNREIYKFIDNIKYNFFYTINEIYYILIQTKDNNKLVKRKNDDIINNLIVKETSYNINNDICTQLCTLNNNDAIQYIKEYIKKQILKNYKLL